MTELEMNVLFDKFEKLLDKKLESILDKKLESILDKKLKSINSRLDKLDKLDRKMDSLESEIKIVKLTQNYIKETGNISLEKPLDSISLASFLADEKEENSYFKLFR